MTQSLIDKSMAGDIVTIMSEAEQTAANWKDPHNGQRAKCDLDYMSIYNHCNWGTLEKPGICTACGRDRNND